jgi:ketosteroid isomerase-like protein
MKSPFRFVMTILILAVAAVAQADAPAEHAVRQTVESFYEAFRVHSFNNAEKFATDDWNHINPFGGRTCGREATLRELKEVHSTLLKGVSDTIADMDVRFAGADAAVVTVTSR